MNPAPCPRRVIDRHIAVTYAQFFVRLITHWGNRHGHRHRTTRNQATGKDGAVHFLKTSPQVWEAWVTPEAARKIRAAL